MMTLVETGDNYRIFKDKILGLIPYYVLENTSNAVQKQGVWYDVKHTTPVSYTHLTLPTTPYV